MSGFQVLCGDFAHDQEPDEEWSVDGFASAEAAAEYARRFVRDQVEALRGEYATSEALREAYLSFGEYAIAPAFELKPWLDHCIATPATRRADTDYQAIDPNR
ncbi:hypothetical protein [Roseomonas rosulenta]|uniref:hypothetical protein n=1 Tax=Roseomonas rosulenta TaxID=2748667 RepID=UPI0018DFEE5A|nr:hypothetical protein [Roseomonas rosulenta]